ncbi:MAG: hypothetical protein HOQ27_04450 [Dermatophilaceae bacterium]|nr:hypothetical protein [Dermatophilaceae bacterium]NUR81003.1 hypothetical protein [Dermatophilaceae bacterium]
MPKINTQAASATTITAAGNTATAQVQPVGNVGGPVTVHIGVTAVSGAGASWSPVVQFSTDGGSTWLTASADETIPAITATGVTVFRVAQSRGQHVRVSWPTPAGTTPSITADIAIWS